MDSQIVFSFKDLLLFVLWGALIGVFAYLILILRRVLKVIKQVNAIVDDNRTEIDQTLKVVPSLTENIEAITAEVSHDMNQFRGTVENIAETTEAVSGVINEQKSAVSSVSSVVNTLALIVAFFNKFFGHDDDANEEKNSVQKTAAKESDHNNLQ
ncbi:hypothetical protein KHM83_10705 [Fusibacter paucivorans]|uniref:DUF948 domain-containing protein n=1 Tax=Fusibacter paucivorans TaxID=76009 RepID=A0ABS5PRW1_9FIRM|nr:hypothetical protein [Fusibacter paucivorans]MBS7527149.1 hypothetical protein [Fusibacter paucivorans]